MRTEIFSQPATTNQLSTATARKPPDQLVLNYAGLDYLQAVCSNYLPATTATVRTATCLFQPGTSSVEQAPWLRIAH